MHHDPVVRALTERYLKMLVTEWGMYMVDPDIWTQDVKKSHDFMKNIPGFPGHVIDDLRFDNQAQWVKDNGGIIINIERLIAGTAKERSGHPSEAGINRKYIDFTIANDGDVCQCQWCYEVGEIKEALQEQPEPVLTPEMVGMEAVRINKAVDDEYRAEPKQPEPLAIYQTIYANPGEDEDLYAWWDIEKDLYDRLTDDRRRVVYTATPRRQISDEDIEDLNPESFYYDDLKGGESFDWNRFARAIIAKLGEK